MRWFNRSTFLTIMMAALIHVDAASAGADTAQRQAPAAPVGAFPVRKVSDEFPLATFPRVDSSTSAQPLAMLIGCRMTGAECRWTQAKDDRLLFAVALQRPNEPPAEAQKRATLPRALNERIQSSGTNTAYVALIEGRQELILVARAPSEDERTMARQKGVELDAQPVALDAFVFMVSTWNSVTNLTTAQIRQVYTGKITNWKEVGGPDQELHAYARERNSGSQELMETLVMKGEPIAGARAPWVLTSMSGPFLRLATDKQALAYTVFFYAEYMAPREHTRLIAVDGVKPNRKTIRARQYPYVTECFAVIRKDAAADGAARKLRDWLLSPAGQEVVAESGYVPLANREGQP